MNLELKNEKVAFYRKVFSGTVMREETVESVVPDAQPDILQIISADGTVIIRSKESDGGKIYVTAAAMMSVLYIPDGGGGVRRLDVSIPIELSCDVPEAGRNCRIVSKVCLCSGSADMINPRKVLVKICAAANIWCWEKSVLEPSADADSEICTKAGLQLLKEKIELRPITAVTERTFLLSEQVRIPAAKPACAQILCPRVRLTVDEVKTVGTGIICRGKAEMSALYRTETGGTEYIESAAAFSQVLELDDAGAVCAVSALMPTGFYANIDEDSSGEGRVILFEIHAAAQCAAASEMSVDIVSDAYSISHDIEIEMCDASVQSAPIKFEVTEMLRETVSSPSAVRNILCTSVKMGQVTKIASVIGFELQVPIETDITFSTEDGRVQSVQHRSYARIRMPDVHSDVCDFSAYVSGDIYTVPGAEGFEVRIPITVTAYDCGINEVSWVSSINCGEEAETQQVPSLVMRRVSEGDSVWSLAKAYKSTQQVICDVNGIDRGELLEHGKLLLIPKTR